MKEAKEKNLPLAIGLNIVLPGLGYIYMGKWVVGVLACLLVAAIYLTTAVSVIGATWLIFNVIMGIDMAILSKKNRDAVEAATMTQCPNCAESIKKEARICRYCHTELV